MSKPPAFDDMLDAAIDALRGGQPLDAVLAHYPQHASALAPLLEAALDVALAATATYAAPSERLPLKYSSVSSAVERAKWELSRSYVPTPLRATRPWYSRRLTFASLSLPAGIFAVLLLGAGGAAAAAVATTTDADAKLGALVEHVTPAWSHAVIPGGEDGSDTSVTVPATTATAGASGAATDATATVSLATAATDDPTGGPGPQAVTVTGQITNVRGNTFELITIGVTYKVQIDANTAVSGAIVEGSTADAEGDLTGNLRLHATSVVVSPATTASESSPEISADDDDHAPPGQADKTKTPADPSESTKTPPGQADKVKTADAPSTPVGQGNGGDNGSDSSN